MFSVLKDMNQDVLIINYVDVLAVKVTQDFPVSMSLLMTHS